MLTSAPAYNVRSLENIAARHKQAQALAHFGNWELSFATGLVHWSDESCRIYGLSIEDDVHTFEFWKSFIHPDDLDYVLEEVTASQATMSDTDSRYRIARKDGTIRHIHSLTNFEFDSTGKPVGLYGVVHDITDSVKSLDRLEKSRKQYQDVFDFSPIPMWVSELDSLRMVDVNQAAIDTYGYSREEFLALTAKDIRPPEELSVLEKAIARLKAIGDVPLDGIYRHARKDGTIIIVEARARQVVFNKMPCALIAATDITERTKYIDTVERQNQALRDITWMQSHVVRAPLARMMTLVELIGAEYPTSYPDMAYMQELTASGIELDAVIRTIVERTNEITDGHKNCVDKSLG